DTIPKGPLIVLANEFLDALPIRQIVSTPDGWRERAVGLHDGRFVFTTGAPADGPASTGPDGTVIERSPDGEAWMRAVTARLIAHGGAALVVDYGAAAPGAG